MADMNVPPPDRKKAGLNGYDKAGYSKQVMVNASDVERSMLEVSLQCVRDNPDARRPDGRKSPYMLCAEEALRLRTEMRAREQELETLRAQLKLALSDEKIMGLQNALVVEAHKNEQLQKTATDYKAAYTTKFEQFRALRQINVELGFERQQSRWFRLGRWLGFYR